MKSPEFYLYSAFSDNYFGGNPAGVIYHTTDIPNQVKQLIAREINAPETLFISPDADRLNKFNCQFFTPTQEVKYCGHATIAGSMFVKQKFYQTDETVEYTQQTKAGDFNIEIIRDVIWTEQRQPEFKQLFSPSDINSLLQISESKLSLGEANIEPQVVNTGLNDLLIPVESLDVLTSLQPDFELITKFCRTHGITGLHVFTAPGTRQGNFYVRNFSPLVGIDEEAATGSANGALAAFLSSKGIIKKNQQLSVDQGDNLSRESKIYIVVDHQDNILVAGKAVKLISGLMHC